VVVDVFRSMTTAVTAVARGRRCFPVPSLDEAARLKRSLDAALLVGEQGGNKPYGFDLTNSPAALAALEDARPIILLSSSGTDLLHVAKRLRPSVIYAGSLRNVSAQVDALAAQTGDVLLAGAATRGEFREEDRYCCARLAGGLLHSGFGVADDATAAVVAEWENAPVKAILVSKSVAYLRETRQDADLDFVLEAVDDLKDAFVFEHDEIVRRAVGS
jgi:2-phosphosulfolactate phosphatase